MKEVNAAIITIGDELLIGQTIDTNSAFIAQELNKIGIWMKRRILLFIQMPILFNSCAIKALLVSMVCPIKSSSPIVIIAAFTSFICKT